MNKHNPEITIDGRKIGKGHKPYIVGEISANHNGSLDKAVATMEMIAAAGADAIKIQTYTADTITLNSNTADFQIIGGPWHGYNLYDLYKQAETPYEWHPILFEKAKQLGITLFSTPFDDTAVDLLESLNTPAYKIASFEITHLPLIKYVAKTLKPIILSTGLANVDEITQAIETARDNGCKELAVLHCVSAYPAPVDQINLATIHNLAKRFNCVVGLSDHTLGTAVAITSVAMGASFIEKHVTLSRHDKGPDSEFSLEPAELTQLCTDANIAWQAIGKPNYDITEAEKQNLKFRRSLYFVKDMQVGDVITDDCVRIVRPGYGIAPKYLDKVLGKVVEKKVSANSAVTWDLLSRQNST